MKMVEAFKNSKKEMEIKMEQASKVADAAADEFIESIKSLAESASERSSKNFLIVTMKQLTSKISWQ